MEAENVFSTCFVAIASMTAKMALMKPIVKIASQPAIMDDVHENVIVT